ncbi:MAG: hypothetical protein ACFCD0_02810 [Gemmataceae bacterium]
MSIKAQGSWPYLAFLCAVLPLGSLSQANAQPKKFTTKVIEYKGWKKNLLVTNGDVELIVTLDVGPRIISYRLPGGKNVFHEYKDQLGKTGEKKWQIRGGHRLWTAPEDKTRTYFPDNNPVKYKLVGKSGVRFTPPPELIYGVQKEIEVHLAPKGTKVKVVHRIKNIKGATASRAASIKLAPWCLSVMAPGGLEIIPLPKSRPHPGPPENAKKDSDYWPSLKVIFWPFYQFGDPRVKFGKKYITVKQQPGAKKPLKFGLLHMLEWIAYLVDGNLFVKRIPRPNKNAKYADLGCNFETWTDGDMLEVETLGPLANLLPGETVEHVERWELFGNLPATRTKSDIDRNVLPKVIRKRMPRK